MQITFLDGYTINPGDLTWEPLKQLGEFTCFDRTAPADVLNRAAGVDVLIVNKTALGREHFAHLPQLKLVCVAATGYDKVDVKAAEEYGVTVCNCVGYSTPCVAQMVVSLLLEVADGVGEYAKVNREGAWSRSPDFCYTLFPRLELAARRVAIVGLGHIGSAVASVLNALGMKVFAVTRKPADALPSFVEKLSLSEAFATCDVVSLNCPLTAQNKGFVNATLLAEAKQGLILINTARGGLIDEEAVAAALADGQLRAYCADVMTCEPPHAGNPLLSSDKVFLTPHIGWNTPEARKRILSILHDNIVAYFAGMPQNVVRL